MNKRITEVYLYRSVVRGNCVIFQRGYESAEYSQLSHGQFTRLLKAINACCTINLVQDGMGYDVQAYPKGQIA